MDIEKKALIEKLAQAEGPSRELDCLIGVAIGRFYTEPNIAWPELLDYVRRNDDGSIIHPGYGGDQMVPRYTASIDAALTLVDLERYDYAIRKTYAHIFNRVGKREDYDAWAPTPAIALCIAALSAKEPSQ